MRYASNVRVMQPCFAQQAVPRRACACMPGKRLDPFDVSSDRANKPPGLLVCAAGGGVLPPELLSS